MPVFNACLETCFEMSSLTSYLSSKLYHFGHAGAPDVVRSLELGSQQGKLRNGDITVLCGAGTGYIWASSCVRWGAIQGQI